MLSNDILSFELLGPHVYNKLILVQLSDLELHCLESLTAACIFAQSNLGLTYLYILVNLYSLYLLQLFQKKKATSGNKNGNHLKFWI